MKQRDLQIMHGSAAERRDCDGTHLLASNDQACTDTTNVRTHADIGKNVGRMGLFGTQWPPGTAKPADSNGEMKA